MPCKQGVLSRWIVLSLSSMSFTQTAPEHIPEDNIVNHVQCTVLGYLSTGMIGKVVLPDGVIA